MPTVKTQKRVATFHDTELYGWSGHGGGRCRVAQPASAEELAALFAEARRLETSIALRGAGTAFGDAALNRAALVADLSRMNRIHAWDAETGRMTVEPGVTFAQLWRRALPDGWWPSVAPNFSAVTIGGAAASDLTGTQSWRHGTFAASVLSFDLLLPSGETVTCGPEERPALFRAALGGWGALGAFTALTLQLRRIHSGDVWQIQSAHGSLDTLLVALEEAAQWAGSLVASLDPRATGGRLGRGLLRAARDLAPDEEPDPAATLTLAHQERQPGIIARARAAAGSRLPTAFATWATRRGEWRRGHGIALLRPHLQSYAAATFTLDDLAARRATLYPHGVLRHESRLPQDTAATTIRALLECTHAAGITPSLARLTKWQPGACLLAVGTDGYSLALDLPLQPGREEAALALVRALNELALEHGGGIALGSDETLTATQARRMLGADALAQFAALKHECDPDGLLRSDLYRRVLAPASASAKTATAAAPQRPKAAVASRPVRSMPSKTSGKKRLYPH